MTSAELIADAFDRVRQTVHRAVEGLPPEKLAARPDTVANSIAWLVWHLTRIQDDHVAGVAGREQTWTSSGWMERFDLPFTAAATGYGQTSEDVAAVHAGSDLLLGYHDAVHEATLAFVRGLGDADLDRVVDTNWNPPVTLGVRLVSVISDDLQHAGQAAYARGLVDRHP
jgi:uncharacterized damage-inducible protein DinB